MTPDSTPSAASPDAIAALNNARQAYKRGLRQETSRWAERAARLAPDWDEPLIWLAAVAAPRASVDYLLRALAINPNNPRARQGLDWAVKRLREVSPAKLAEQTQAHPASPARPSGATRPTKTVLPATSAASALSLGKTQPMRRPVISKSIPAESLAITRSSLAESWASNSRLASWTLALLFLMLLAWLWLGITAFSYNIGADAAGWVEQQVFQPGQVPQSIAQIDISKATRTPTETNTPTSTSTATVTPTPTATENPTSTATPTVKPTRTKRPTKTPAPEPTEKAPYEPDNPDVPSGIGKSENWVDVDLTHQTAYAYTGDTLIRSFLVSTGTWEHPTVTGQYYIYVKYRYADMSGPGYYLPDVPYIMYFYEGYGLHGTYWHNNFGTPMSHGCVNLSIPDAEWLFGFADIGTLVNVHY